MLTPFSRLSEDKEIDKKLVPATAFAITVARRRQDGRKRTVSVKAEQKSRDNGKTATVENAGANGTVLRTENE